MSQQLAISSVFSVIALAGLCVLVTVSDDFDSAESTPVAVVQTELAPGLPG
ncbi:hypothetical protein [Erythrobacter sp. JK5]|uniref:hypothetical protein n=1 Tax=Erythrobacter sp. JK5 TaxID=2829500 RepID=UPI001BA9EEDB|nr:hypothetical protein [Erythrobacter sp. JK5]QUL37935.1 hypothetical protein KDC96_00405 [Erythrobacter sp. JK5]